MKKPGFRLSLIALSLISSVGFSQEGPRPVLPTGDQLNLPGATWDSLKDLPAFTGSQWVPLNTPGNELAYLDQLQLPQIRQEYRSQVQNAIEDILDGAATPPSESCDLEGMPRMAWYPYPLQFLYGPANVMIQQHDMIRATQTLGLQRRQTDDNSFVGYIITGDPVATWEGDTLVIETIHVREDKGVFYGLDNDPDLKFTERYRLVDKDTLEKTVTMEAPTYFEAPWTFTTRYQRKPEASWATKFCLPQTENTTTSVVSIPESARNPAPANARFTPDMTRESIKSLPKFWGIGWMSGGGYDGKVTNYENITIWPPLKEEYQQDAESYIRNQVEGKGEFKFAGCWPNGVPRHQWFAYPPVFFFKPGNSILLDVGGETREIYMDGRGHPASLDRSDTAIAYLGHSIGWWEGETLVIDTVGFAPEDDLFYGVPNSGNMHVQERYRLLDSGNLELTMTVTDDERMTQPWVLVRDFPGNNSSAGNMQAGPGGTRLETWQCRPGDAREVVDIEGNSHVDLTPPPMGLGLGTGE